MEIEVAIQTHEGLGSRVPQGSKAALVVVGIQNTDLRQWLVVHAEQLRNYEEVKRHVRAYLTNERALREAARPPVAPDTEVFLARWSARAQEPLLAERPGLRRQREDADRVWPEVQTSTAAAKGRGKGQKAKGKDVDYGGARRREAKENHEGKKGKGSAGDG